MLEQGCHPFGRPAALERPVDSSEWLERERVVVAATERVMGAAASEHGGACRKPLVEDIDLRLPVAPEPELEGSEQQGLARADWANDQHVPDVAALSLEQDLRRPFGPPHPILQSSCRKHVCHTGLL